MERVERVRSSTLAGDLVRVRAPEARCVTDTRCNTYVKNGDYFEAPNALPLIAGVDMITITEPDEA